MVTKVDMGEMQSDQPVAGSRPVPDPTLLTTQQLVGAIASLKELFITSHNSLAEASKDAVKASADVIGTRLDGMDKAIELLQKSSDKIPEFVRDQVGQLRDLHGEKILGTSDTVKEKIATQDQVSDERFKSIQIQFTLLKQATEQLDLANKTAIAAALQAQKESAGETQKSSQAAIAKSETSTSEAIKALTTAFNAAILGATDRINEIKSRLDRGEGKTNVTDPMIESRLVTIMSKLDSVTSSRDSHAGSETNASVNSAKMMAMAAVAVALAVGIGEIVIRVAH
jgi:hypothetical protein